ncbi:hypothetical protein BS333_21245 (plasmid) [Vibrio azureus]|uniref:hypothetical protein n=1 Tax=Vibrio azureus TaxID=512649 RepID=UPI0005191616|nr:hypothetical protein [Vibrio azureus]AUI88908.1 hypothetical protein BS333_21245 [Vibrio azureus]
MKFSTQRKIYRSRKKFHFFIYRTSRIILHLVGGIFLGLMSAAFWEEYNSGTMTSYKMGYRRVIEIPEFFQFFSLLASAFFGLIAFCFLVCTFIYIIKGYCKDEYQASRREWRKNRRDKKLKKKADGKP